MAPIHAQRRRLSFTSLVALTAVAGAALCAPAAAQSRKSAEAENENQSSTEQRGYGTARLAIVSLGDQRVTLYDTTGAPIMHGPVSSGASPNDTPPGIYSILQKNREHYSNRYDDAAMPFMQRITWTGVALHGGALPGYPASHGCVRLRNNFAGDMFELTKLGMRVIVSRNNMAPTPISHPKLFKHTPYQGNVAVLTKAAHTMPMPTEDGRDTRYEGGPNDPPELAARMAAFQAIAASKRAEAGELERKATEARDNAKKLARQSANSKKAVTTAERNVKRAADSLAYAERVLSKATKPNSINKAEAAKTKAEERLAAAQAKLEAVNAEMAPALEESNRAEEAAKAAETELQEVVAAARDAERKLSPVSVFVSRAAKKLYVRQDMEPVFETDVTIVDEDRQIGTHTFTALDFEPGRHDLRWNVVSIEGRQGNEPLKASGMYRHKLNASVPSIPTDADAAAAALDRIEIPEEARARISELVLPGSSLIVSDEPLHKETGKATEFVVLLSGELQGGIILRPKPKPEVQDDYYVFNWGGFGYYNNQPQRRQAAKQQKKKYNQGPFPWW
ncbi:L,D-transpeptidase family protein [Hyphomicrobium sulfonivorans]|uniref:L,D-transpeptidase family protein n=1 Tax=Hyphomicrobium sulfonivorans TaxID=121290 RepID=UPI00156FEBF1|nr:L,D-transpeptidase family protein [Hyphomicrobium sulfonivorans]MBI1650033.1 L,D-transpeptidase family protein [Hyphomicrobium sulfonivorans]NSL72952.1 L,D-transpeptidase [Hyphomicrobium sulfonivorans]